MSEEAKQEEPKIEDEQESSELSDEQLEEAPGGYYDEFQSFRTLSPAASKDEPDPTKKESGTGGAFQDTSSGLGSG